MHKMDTAAIRTNELVDIRDVQIDSSMPTEEKIKAFVEQVKNPYCFKVGSVVVRVSYTGEKTTMNEQFANMLMLL
ncbi:MAG: hypothetical protein PHY23_00995 [Oscillospiraceae bacterium]|nr:hypothetical protein [Oscillospiraceae bacterium]